MLEHAELKAVEPQFEIRDDNERLVSRADFAFPQIKYAVYCDGRQWHLRQARWQRDLRQRNDLTALGWAFSVFTGRQINRDARECAAQVLKTFEARSKQ
jgi:very-short-patch-repair endonuclease